MPRLKQVSLKDATDNVKKYYAALFNGKDPVTEPGTATGTPGNWWTVFALVPYIFDHATGHFGMFGMFADKSVSQLDGKVRELGIMRAGYAQASQFVFSQHCKAARRFGSPMNRFRRFRTGRFLRYSMLKKEPFWPGQTLLSMMVDARLTNSLMPYIRIFPMRTFSS